MQLLFVLAIIPLGVAFGYAILVTEMLKAISEFMTAKEIVARLEGELAVVAALRSPALVVADRSVSGAFRASCHVSAVPAHGSFKGRTPCNCSPCSLCLCTVSRLNTPWRQCLMTVP